MGSSAKKKAEKKKDFQKQTFKVGKQKPKAANFTDTSFSSKGIVVKEQSLATSAPSPRVQFDHHLSLLSSRTDRQRENSLSFLAAFIANREDSERLPLGQAEFFDKLLPLTLDGSGGVRRQLLRLFKSLRDHEVLDQSEKLLRFVRAGMMHLAEGIRDTSMEVLSWALTVVSQELVTCAGGWIKTLRYFATMLSWNATGIAPRGSVSAHLPASDSPLTVKVLRTLGQYLQAGLEKQPVVYDPEWDPATYFPYVDIPYHRIPRGRANPYGYLNLFATNRSEDDVEYIDREERQQSFAEELRHRFQLGLADLKRQAGETGRAAAHVETVIADGMADHT